MRARLLKGLLILVLLLIVAYVVPVVAVLFLALAVVLWLALRTADVDVFQKRATRRRVSFYTSDAAKKTSGSIRADATTVGSRLAHRAVEMADSVVKERDPDRSLERRLDTADLRRSKSAAGKANKALKEAQKAGQGQEAAGPILTAYMEEKLNRPVAGLSHTQLAALLADKGVDDDLSRRVQNCLMLSEMGRYAPVELTLKQGNLWTETEAVISELDAQLAG